MLQDFTAGCSTEMSVSTGEADLSTVYWPRSQSARRSEIMRRLCPVLLQARRWSCWNGRANGPVGVWSGPPSAAHLRRDWFPVLRSACPTLAPAWRWTASSAGKVGGSSELEQGSLLLWCRKFHTNNRIQKHRDVVSAVIVNSFDFCKQMFISAAAELFTLFTHTLSDS